MSLMSDARDSYIFWAEAAAITRQINYVIWNSDGPRYLKLGFWEWDQESMQKIKKWHFSFFDFSKFLGGFVALQSYKVIKNGKIVRRNAALLNLYLGDCTTLNSKVLQKTETWLLKT